MTFLDCSVAPFLYHRKKTNSPPIVHSLLIYALLSDGPSAPIRLISSPPNGDHRRGRVQGGGWS